MRTYTANFLEEQLSKRLNKKVELRESFYSAEEDATYRKIYIDGQKTKTVFDLEDLTEYERRGILDKQLDKLAAKLNNGE